MMDIFQFKDDYIEQQLNDTRSLDEIRRLNEKYHFRLLNELKAKAKAKAKAKHNTNQNKNKVYRRYRKFQINQIQHLKNKLQHKNSTLDAIKEDVNVANLPITELTKSRDNLLSSNNNYLRKINDLEQLRVLQGPNYMSEIHVLDQQLTAMQIDISKKVEKHQDLMNIENITYRKLLVSEQRGLDITPNPSVVGGPSVKKSKLFGRGEIDNKVSNIITVSSTSDIEIGEVCPDGQFVQLYNKGSKFHGSVNLGAGNSLTVWSSTASNQIHKYSAGSIIMDIQAWVVGDYMATILLNPEGQEVATHKLKKRLGFSFTIQ
ncbi:lamin Dm0-like isoform X3 [Metopolophium dirhodum]|uniref:lamin Dm0-like isoform X3 n=1 Tax=Metopolophium dirhodum TaxID=44670 RepID=UPI00298FD002|nr:lamin Dm0-like isoform X3 [Metopolophium dirhodum]